MSPAGAQRPRRLASPIVLACGLYALVAFGPLAALLWHTVRFVGLTGWSAMVGTIAPGTRSVLLARSSALALATSMTCIAFGLLIATVLTRWRNGRPSLLRWLLLLLAPVPPYVHALAWTLAAYRWSEHLVASGLPPLPLRGAWGALWVEVMALLPFAAGLALLAIEGVAPELVEAARVLAPDMQVFRKVILPLAWPALSAAAALLFLLCLLDYGVWALFQVNVYPLAIFAEFSATNEAERAFLMALPLLLVTSMTVLGSQGGLRQLGRRAQRMAAPAEAPLSWPRWWVILQILALFVLVLHLGVPTAVMLGQVRAWSVFLATVAAAKSEIALTGMVALTAAVISLPIAIGAARPLLGTGQRHKLWWLVVTLPLAMPAPLVGIGLIALWATLGALPVYGSLAMPVLASLARFLPFATLAVLAQLRQIDPLLVDAARVHQPSVLQGWLQVRLPMLAPGLLAAFGVTFALTVGELGATLLVLPPGHSTLSIRIYNYMHYGASEAVASLCLVLSLAACLAGCLAAGAVLAWSRLLPRRRV